MSGITWYKTQRVLSRYLKFLRPVIILIVIGQLFIFQTISRVTIRNIIDNKVTRILWVWQGTRIDALDYSPDGKWLASVSGDYENVILWRIYGKGRHYLPVKCIPGLIGGRVIFSNNGKYMISVGEDNEIKLWELPGIRLVSRMEVFSDKPADRDVAISYITVSSNTNLIAYATEGGIAKLYRLKGDKITGGVYIKQDDGIGAIALSPDGGLLAARTNDSLNGVNIYDTNNGRLLKHLREGTRLNQLPQIAFSPDNSIFATVDYLYGRVWLREINKGWRSRKIDLRSRLRRGIAVDAVAFTPDNRLLVGSLSGVTIWRINDSDIVMTYNTGDDRALAFALSPDGRELATGSFCH